MAGVASGHIGSAQGMSLGRLCGGCGQWTHWECAGYEPESSMLRVWPHWPVGTLGVCRV